MKLSNSWLLAILGALICCTLVANGQRHERTPETDAGVRSSRGKHRFTSTEEDAVHWDPEKTDAKPPTTHVVKHTKLSTQNTQTTNRDDRRSNNYRTESRHEQTAERTGVRISPKRTNEDISKTNRESRNNNNRRTESQRLIDSEQTERKQPVVPKQVEPTVESSLKLTPVVPIPTRQSPQTVNKEKATTPSSHDGEIKSKRQQRNERIGVTQKVDITERTIKANRSQRNNSPRHGNAPKLLEPSLDQVQDHHSSNRRMDTDQTYDVEATEQRETLIDQENVADYKSNLTPILPRPTRESRPSKRENISPDTNDISKTNRGGRNGRRGSSQSSDTSEPTETRGRSHKSSVRGDNQETADVKPSKRQQGLINSRSTDSSISNTITPAAPRPTRETQTSRGRSHYSAEAKEETEPIKSRGRNVERGKDTVRSSRGQSRNSGSSKRTEDESTTAGRGRQYSRREPSPRTEEITSRTKTESGSRRGPPESRRESIRSRNLPTNDVVESKRDATAGKSEKVDSRRTTSSRRPSSTPSNERKTTPRDVETREDSPKRRDPSRSRGGRPPTGRPNKPKKSLDFEINEDDNYPQEFIQKIRQSSEVQAPLTSSTEDVVDVEEAAVTYNSPASSSVEVGSTESASVRAPTRTSSFNPRRTKPSGVRNTNNVTPSPETTLPSVPRASNARLQSLLKSRYRSNPADSSSTTEAPRVDLRSRFSRLKGPSEVDNAIIPEEEIVSSSVATFESLLPEPTQNTEPLVPKKPGFRPRQTFVPKPRTPEINNLIPSPRGSLNGNLRPRPTQFSLPRTSSEISRQIPSIATRLKTITSEGRRPLVETSNPLFRGLQRPTLSTKLKPVNFPKPQIIEEQVEEQQIQAEDEEDNVTTKITPLNESEENDERTPKFKPKTKDLTVPKYTSGFRRNLPGTTSFETRNEVRTTTQLAGVVPKHRFSSRYRSDLAKTASRSATPAYVATVPTIVSTAGTTSTTTPSPPPSTIEYVFRETNDAGTVIQTEMSLSTTPFPPTSTEFLNELSVETQMSFTIPTTQVLASTLQTVEIVRAAKELLTPPVVTSNVVVPQSDVSNSVYTGGDSKYNNYWGSSSSTTEKPKFRVLTTSLNTLTTARPKVEETTSTSEAAPTSTTVFRWKPVLGNDIDGNVQTTTTSPVTTTTRGSTTKRPVTTPPKTTTQRATGLANLIFRALGVGTTTKPKITINTQSSTTAQTTTVPVTTTKKPALVTTTTTTKRPTTTTTTTKKPTTTTTTTKKPTTTTTTTKKPTTTTTTTTTPKPTTTTTTTTTTPKPTTTTTTTTTPKPTTTTTTTTTTPKPTTTTTKKPTTTTKKPTTTTKKPTTTTKKPTTTTQKPTTTTTTTTTTEAPVSVQIITPDTQPLTTRNPDPADNYINDILLLNTLLQGQAGPGVSPRSGRKPNAQEALANQIIELALQQAAVPQSRSRISTTTEDYRAFLGNLVSPRSLSSQASPQNKLQSHNSPESGATSTKNTTEPVFDLLAPLSTQKTKPSGKKETTNSPVSELTDDELLAILLQAQTPNMPPSKKPKTTRKPSRPTTTIPPPTGLRWLLQAVSSGDPNRGASAGRSPLAGISTPLIRDPAPPNDGDDIEGGPAAADPGLLSAAINVTRAVSQFMGVVIQGAADSFQNYVRQRTGGFLANYFTFGPNS